MQEYNRKRKKGNPRWNQERHLWHTYKLTLEQYDSLLEAQDGACAMCDTSDPLGQGNFHVDHCHETGAIRGLLCHACNTGLGLLGDSIQEARRRLDKYESRM